MNDSTRAVEAQVNSLEFGSAAGERLGTYRQVGRTAWQELGVDGDVGFTFVEISRDDRAVVLRDQPRNVDLTLDLERNIVVYTDANQQFDLYSILSTSGRVNGRTATEAQYTSFDGHDLGVYRHTGDGVWCEFDRLGTAHFVFDETNRDDWSVYLHDQSRDVAIQLDFHRSRVVYRNGSNDPADLYGLGDRRGVSDRPYTEPATNGRTVNAVTATGERRIVDRLPTAGASHLGRDRRRRSPTVPLHRDESNARRRLPLRRVASRDARPARALGRHHVQRHPNAALLALPDH